MATTASQPQPLRTWQADHARVHSGDRPHRSCLVTIITLTPSGLKVRGSLEGIHSRKDLQDSRDPRNGHTQGARGHGSPLCRQLFFCPFWTCSCSCLLSCHPHHPNASTALTTAPSQAPGSSTAAQPWAGCQCRTNHLWPKGARAAWFRAVSLRSGSRLQIPRTP